MTLSKRLNILEGGRTRVGRTKKLGRMARFLAVSLSLATAIEIR